MSGPFRVFLPETAVNDWCGEAIRWCSQWERERAAVSISGRHILSKDEREFNDKLRIKANQCHHYLQIKGNESTLRTERERKKCGTRLIRMEYNWDEHINKQRCEKPFLFQSNLPRVRLSCPPLSHSLPRCVCSLRIISRQGPCNQSLQLWSPIPARL